MHQDATWYGGRPQPRGLCVRWGPSPLPNKGGGAPLPNFRPISTVVKRLDASRCHLVWSYASAQGTLCFMGIQPLPKRGRSPPIFGLCLLWPNGRTDQDGTWHGGRPQPRRLCVRWGPSPLPNFGPFLLRPNGCIDQDATWYGGRPRPRRHCVRWGCSSIPSPKRGRSPLPNFRPMSIVVKQLDGSRWHLAWRWALVQATLC